MYGPFFSDRPMASALAPYFVRRVTM